jgi:hypothetical protein
MARHSLPGRGRSSALPVTPQCAQCATTQKQSWMVVSGDELCFPCYDKRVMREQRKFGEPGDGNLFKGWKSL